MSLEPLERLLSARRAVTGRPAKDRAALATAFIAKAILNLGTTRDLIARLKVDEPLQGGFVGGAARANCRMRRSSHAPSLQVPRRYRVAAAVTRSRNRTGR